MLYLCQSFCYADQDRPSFIQVVINRFHVFSNAEFETLEVWPIELLKSITNVLLKYSVLYNIIYSEQSKS